MGQYMETEALVSLFKHFLGAGKNAKSEEQ